MTAFDGHTRSLGRVLSPTISTRLPVKGGCRDGLLVPLTPPPCVTFRLVVVSLRGPGQSPVLPFACSRRVAAFCRPPPKTHPALTHCRTRYEGGGGGLGKIVSGVKPKVLSQIRHPNPTFAPMRGGGSVQLRTQTPTAWAGGSKGGRVHFFGFWGHFGFPCFILSSLNIHKLGGKQKYTFTIHHK